MAIISIYKETKYTKKDSKNLEKFAKSISEKSSESKTDNLRINKNLKIEIL